jgi:hypothetical protein
MSFLIHCFYGEFIITCIKNFPFQSTETYQLPLDVVNGSWSFLSRLYGGEQIREVKRTLVATLRV